MAMVAHMLVLVQAVVSSKAPNFHWQEDSVQVLEPYRIFEPEDIEGLKAQTNYMKIVNRQYFEQAVEALEASIKIAVLGSVEVLEFS